MCRSVKLAIAAVSVAVLAGGGVLAWYLFSDDAPPPPSLPSAAGTASDPPAAEGLDGQWTVRSDGTVTEDGTFVGYRVEEVLTGVTRTAVGRTASIDGALTIQGTTVTAASFTADLTSLQSDDGRRDRRMRDIGLQTADFPAATFELTQPIALSIDGAVLDAQAVGTLTLHGTTRQVTIPLQAQRNDDGTFAVVGTLDVLFADYGIDTPNIAGFVTTEDRGALELQLFFERA